MVLETRGFGLASLLAFAFAAGFDLDPRAAGALGRGDLAPELRLADLEGDSVVVTTPAAPGPAALLFWATWCSSCRREIPRILDALLRARAQGLPVHAVAVESKPEDVRRFVEEKAPGLPVVLDSDGKAGETAFSIKTVPTLVLVGRDGTILHHGKLERRRLGSQLRAIAEDPAAAAAPGSR